MAIELTSVSVKTPQRIRLTFSNTLGAGAFGPVPSFYIITPTSALAAPTIVRAALIVLSSGSVVELALSDELIAGGTYTVSAIGVPSTTLGDVTTSASVMQFTNAVPVSSHILQVESKVDDGEVLLYSRDLIHNGTDFQLTAAGDLARISGAANAVAAVSRRMFSDGLPWNDKYGAKPRQYVDAVPGIMGNLRTSLMGQAYADDRVKSVAVTYAFDDTGQVIFSVDTELVGGHQTETIPVTVSS